MLKHNIIREYDMTHFVIIFRFQKLAKYLFCIGKEKKKGYSKLSIDSYFKTLSIFNVFLLLSYFLEDWSKIL